MRPIKTSPLKNWWPLALVAGGLAVLFFCNPATHSFFPPCLFHQWTGWHCPGCGATRATHALLHGRLAEAWQHNALLVLSLPLSAMLGGRYFLRGRRWPVVSRAMLWLALAVVVVFAVVRNLPVGARLAP